VGVPIAHSLISFLSLSRGLDKLQLNRTKIEQDLSNNWMVVSEAIQTILRWALLSLSSCCLIHQPFLGWPAWHANSREGVKEPYELMKKLTRTNEAVDQQHMEQFIDGLEGISDAVKQELKAITPANYIGIIPKQ